MVAETLATQTQAPTPEVQLVRSSDPDRTLVPRGRSRAPLRKFLLWMLPWVALLAVGVYAATLCLAVGLNQTNMDNRFAFGLWIFLDLTVIALGAGAFFSGFLMYVLRRKELKAVINAAVVVGFVCYSGAVVVLMVDVGQPLRAWFTFWHPNVHSMLAEVTFCITCYLIVLAIEYIPIVLKNRKLREKKGVFVFEHQLHHLMVVLAVVGTVLSFFHQGSLGGLYGVLEARPFAHRESVGIWPTTFFLFIASAIATGPVFLALVTKTAAKVTGKRLVTDGVYDTLGKISGWLLTVYVLLKSLDTLLWLNHTSPSVGVPGQVFYQQEPYGTWILLTEIVVLGLLPAAILLFRRTRQKRGWFLLGALLACGGVALNRFVMTMQTLSLPTLSFEPFGMYWPSWQETATFLAVVAYGVLVFSLSYRYLTLYPQERELNPAAKV